MAFRNLACLFISTLVLAAACTDDGSGDGGDGQSCPEGSEGCPCYGNKSCDGALTCGTNDKCEATASGGTSSGGAGGGATGGSSASGGSGGSNTGGSVGGAAGGSAGNGGSNQAGGGAMNGGTAGSAVGGTSGTSSGGMSGSAGASGSSGTGGGGPLWSPCFGEGDFANCGEACASIAATCVAQGCDMATWRAWGMTTPERCETLQVGSGAGADACDTALSWNAGFFVRRCCCGTR